jgi:hypothetical protein
MSSKFIPHRKGSVNRDNGIVISISHHPSLLGYEHLDLGLFIGEDFLSSLASSRQYSRDFSFCLIGLSSGGRGRGLGFARLGNLPFAWNLMFQGPRRVDLVDRQPTTGTPLPVNRGKASTQVADVWCLVPRPLKGWISDLIVLDWIVISM